MTDNIKNTTNIEAVFEGEVKTFPSSTNFVSLVDTLKKSFGDIGSLFVLQGSGAFTAVSSDVELEGAKANAVSSLRIFLTPNVGNGSGYLARKYLTKWMQKNASGSIPVAQHVVASLVVEGFKPKVIKKNFHLILENAGDVDMTLAIFHSSFQAKNNFKALKRRNSSNEGSRKKRRCSGGRGSKNSSDRMAVDTPSDSGNGQTHELAKEFLEIAATAYPEDVGQKLKAKQFAKVILDGNNMLFVTNGLRGATLHGKRTKAEKMLSVAALAFSQIIGITTEIVFDATKLPKAKNSDLKAISMPEIPIVHSNLSEFSAQISQIAIDFPVVGVPLIFPNGTVVSVSSARPEFDTTDDKLIAWARANSQQPAVPSSTTTMSNSSQEPAAVSTSTTTTTSTTLTTATTSTNVATTTSTASPLVIPNSSILVVSSDRALAGELCSLGVSLMKPGVWISFFVALISAEESASKGSAFQSFDNWVSGVVDK